MNNPSWHSINHFFEIEVIQPKFDKLYLEYKKLVGGEVSLGKNVNSKNKYVIFDIPKKSSLKIQKLLEEINDLPVMHIKKYSNLIAHQLRTILSLALIEYWESINKKILPQDKRDSLKKMISHTLLSAKNEKLKNAGQIVSELNDIKGSKIKDLVDDVVHCNYTLANKSDAEKFISNIKHLLSLIYGR